MTASEIVAAALTKDPVERAGYVRQACGGDRRLLEEADALLMAHTAVTATISVGASSVSFGSQIGPYKLIRPIGEGGMGVVYHAQQTQPLRRDVALKVIKPGMDSREVIARFESERQALALMDHPHIARVFDAGTTAEGRPYFAMELVDGVPITRYCDAKRLTVERTNRLVHPGLSGDSTRAPEGHHPPRHQAVESPGDGARGTAGRQGDRFRSGQGARAIN